MYHHGDILSMILQIIRFLYHSSDIYLPHAIMIIFVKLVFEDVKNAVKLVFGASKNAVKLVFGIKERKSAVSRKGKPHSFCLLSAS